MIDIDKRIKQLQTDAVVGAMRGNPEQGASQLNANFDAIKQLIRDVLVEVKPTKVGITGDYDPMQSWNDAITDMETKIKELGL